MPRAPNPVRKKGCVSLQEIPGHTVLKVETMEPPWPEEFPWDVTSRPSPMLKLQSQSFNLMTQYDPELHAAPCIGSINSELFYSPCYSKLFLPLMTPVSCILHLVWYWRKFCPLRDFTFRQRRTEELRCLYFDLYAKWLVQDRDW